MGGGVGMGERETGVAVEDVGGFVRCRFPGAVALALGGISLEGGQVRDEGRLGRRRRGGEAIRAPFFCCCWRSSNESRCNESVDSFKSLVSLSPCLIPTTRPRSDPHARPQLVVWVSILSSSVSLAVVDLEDSV